MTRITSIAAVLERFRAGQCRRRPRTMAEVLGQFRKRDGRRAYFAVYEKRQRAEQRAAAARVRVAR